MKIIKRVALSLLIVLILISGYIYYSLSSSAPEYSGEKTLSGLQAGAEIGYDDYGIPHIFSENSGDAYFALGFAMARERLFQMDMMRRAGSGRLAELFGEELVSADFLFHSLNLPAYNTNSAKQYQSRTDSSILKDNFAFLDGINAFIKEDHLPPEYFILRTEPRLFELKDMFHISGYMAFSFALGQRTDPLADYIWRNLGTEYLKGTGLHHYSEEPFIPTHYPAEDLSSISSELARIRESLPLPWFSGSNSWAVSGDKTKSGKPILCNDTHIGHAMPSIWFEAQMSFPGHDVYGNFLPGIPYALVGHGPGHAWGITMLENDDMDFYRNTKNIGQERQFQIIVKGEAEVRTHTVQDTPMGPEVSEAFGFNEDYPDIVLQWDYTRHTNYLMEAFRKMNFSQSQKDFEEAIALVHGPGLNTQYADSKGNIAWYATGKLLKRENSWQSKFILDLDSVNVEKPEYYSFEENPKSVNPPSGFIYSANDQPGPMQDSTFYPGYYKPHHRANRIKELLSSGNNWDTESMMNVINDVTSTVDAELTHFMVRELPDSIWDVFNEECVILSNWGGRNELNDIAPTLFYKWLYHILENSMQDELGEKRFNDFLGTHWFKRAYVPMIQSELSPWWDDRNTDILEDRQFILIRSFLQTISELRDQLGKDPDQWHWGRSRMLHIKHPMGQIPILGSLFNTGPSPIRGGHETISQTGFTLNSEGQYDVRVGPQMRIIHDLSESGTSLSVLPSGQSGHPFSDHYDDQFNMYLNGEFRAQLSLDSASECSRLLELKP